MNYMLSNGEEITFQRNVDVAKFMYITSPRFGLTIVGPNKPSLVMTPEVKKIYCVAEKLRYKRKMIDMATKQRMTDLIKQSREHISNQSLTQEELNSFFDDDDDMNSWWGSAYEGGQIPKDFDDDIPF